MKVYRSMRGKVVELDKLIMRNETELAVSNVKMNARGDELGPNNQVFTKHEDFVPEPHGSVIHPPLKTREREQPEPQVALKALQPEPQPAVEKPKPIQQPKKSDDKEV